MNLKEIIYKHYIIQLVEELTHEEDMTKKDIIKRQITALTDLYICDATPPQIIKFMNRLNIE